MRVRRERLGYTARRRRLPRSVRLVLALVLVLVLYVAIAAVRQAGPGDAGVPVDQALTPAQPVQGAGDQQVLASADGLELHAVHPSAALVAFSGATREEALSLSPAVGAAEQVVLQPAGGGTAPTTAADIVVPDEGPVRTPVDGTVVEVAEYALSGAVRDVRVVIEPTGRPDLAVVLVHLQGPAVETGDPVTGGETPLGQARPLPFTMPVDLHAPSEAPHVRLEVVPAGPPDPVDPNATALPAPGLAGDA